MLVNSLLTPGDTQKSLAAKFKGARLDRGHSRSKAAKLTGVPEPTLRDFETKFRISLRQFLMLCHVYGELSACEQIFPEPEIKSMKDLLATSSKPKRQRGRS